MGFTEIIKIEDIQLKDAILLEGLPGVGNVGKLAATHLIEELKAKKCMEIYSSHFPPQVLIDDDGIVTLVNNELYYYNGSGKTRDLLFLVGEKIEKYLLIQFSNILFFSIVYKMPVEVKIVKLKFFNCWITI